MATIDPAVDPQVYTNVTQTFEVAAGETLKVETSPGGVEHLSGTVPSGKKWIVQLNLHVQEEAL